MGSYGVWRYGVFSYEDVDLAERDRERAALCQAEADDRASILATRQSVVERIHAATEMPEDAAELLDEAIEILRLAKLRAYARLVTRDYLSSGGSSAHG